MLIDTDHLQLLVTSNIFQHHQAFNMEEIKLLKAVVNVATLLLIILVSV